MVVNKSVIVCVYAPTQTLKTKVGLSLNLTKTLTKWVCPVRNVLFVVKQLVHTKDLAQKLLRDHET